MIDFEWYRSFISIYKHRSVSAAAKARILTQPAMSQHLAALEAEVGEPLFIRATRKMIPTDKGKELYTTLVPLIEKLESTTLEIRHVASEPQTPIVRIGSPGEYFTKKALPSLKRVDGRLSIQFGVATKLLELLQGDEVDLIITTQKLQVPGIESVKIEEEQFVVTAPYDVDSTLTEIGEIESWLDEQRWLSYGLELPIVRRFWREHFGKRPPIQPYHIIPDLRVVLKAIEEGMGISVLPTYLIADSVEANKTKILFPHLAVNNTIYMAYKNDVKDYPPIQQVRHLLSGDD
ncbi:LysR family transcriptional regulator [Priestia koreensis]|uniref:LysR family transcriptional regulator n=1 Tax=Priestia koreensis TaxID=284581 RepID=UPI001F592F3A|nr:LysR family transcriptional regulator [Priestia koreensis]UNL83065.1 LysR family transcriptional regulator [Priestia koreensis]